MANGLANWAARTVGVEPADEDRGVTSEERRDGDEFRVGKQAVLYLHVFPDNGLQTQYECRDCSMFVSDANQCTIHTQDTLIEPTGSCGYWVFGVPVTSEVVGATSRMLTPLQSGYAVNPYGTGFSCKRCNHFVAKVLVSGEMDESGGCNVVDFDTPGDDPGMIHPDACCNAWEADADRVQMEAGEFARHQAIRQA